MNRQNLNYASPSQTTRSPARRPLRIAILFATILALLSLPFISVQQSHGRIDAVTGTLETWTTWPFGLTTGRTLDVSPLERRLKQIGHPWTRDWRTLYRTDRTLLGHPTRRACGSAPEIHTPAPTTKPASSSTSCRPAPRQSDAPPSRPRARGRSPR